MKSLRTAAPFRLNPYEKYEQARLVAWFKHIGIPDDAFTAIPHGSEKLSEAEAAERERQGVRPGAFDIVFWTFPPIGLEMKRQKGGRVSPDQKLVHARATAARWDVIVAPGCEAAKSALLQRRHFRDLIAYPHLAHLVPAA